MVSPTPFLMSHDPCLGATYCLQRGLSLVCCRREPNQLSVPRIFRSGHILRCPHLDGGVQGERRPAVAGGPVAGGKGSRCCPVILLDA